MFNESTRVRLRRFSCLLVAFLLVCEGFAVPLFESIFPLPAAMLQVVFFSGVAVGILSFYLALIHIDILCLLRLSMGVYSLGTAFLAVGYSSFSGALSGRIVAGLGSGCAAACAIYWINQSDPRRDIILRIRSGIIGLGSCVLPILIVIFQARLEFLGIIYISFILIVLSLFILELNGSSWESFVSLLCLGFSGTLFFLNPFFNSLIQIKIAYIFSAFLYLFQCVFDAFSALHHNEMPTGDNLLSSATILFFTSLLGSCPASSLVLLLLSNPNFSFDNTVRVLTFSSIALSGIFSIFIFSNFFYVRSTLTMIVYLGAFFSIAFSFFWFSLSSFDRDNFGWLSVSAGILAGAVSALLTTEVMVHISAKASGILGIVAKQSGTHIGNALGALVVMLSGVSGMIVVTFLALFVVYLVSCRNRS